MKTRIPRLLNTSQQAVLGLLLIYNFLPNNRNITNVGFPHIEKSPPPSFSFFDTYPHRHTRREALAECNTVLNYKRQFPCGTTKPIFLFITGWRKSTIFYSLCPKCIFKTLSLKKTQSIRLLTTAS